MIEINSKLAQRLRVPVTTWHEPEAHWVDKGHDGHLHPCIRKVDAADTAIILSGHVQVVLAAEFLGVASRLQGGHHELVLIRDLLHFALLFLFISNLVLDLIKLQFELLFPVALVGSRSIAVLRDDRFALRIVVAVDFLLHHLSDGEFDSADSNIAVLVVDLDFAFSVLLRRENVLVELGSH